MAGPAAGAQQLPAGSVTKGVPPSWKRVTSGGSTGRPKLIAATAPALLKTVAGLAPPVGLPSGQCALMTGPLSHNAPFVAAAAGLLPGGHVVLMSRFDPAQTLRLIEQHQASWLYLVPTMMLRIRRLPEAVRLAAGPSSLKAAFHVAAPCPPWLKQAWIDRLGPQKVHELYAGTKLQAATVITGTEWLAHRGVGRPRGARRDRHTRPRWPARFPWRGGGDLDAPGPGRPFSVPVHRRDGTQRRRLGIARRHRPVDADGYVCVTDRLTDMILIGGANVYPAEIEAAPDEHPTVRSCCVNGLPHEDPAAFPTPSSSSPNRQLMSI